MPISQLLEENITLIKLLCSVLNQFTQKFIVIVKINPNKKHDLVFIRAINDAFEVINMTHEVRVITDDPRYYELILAADVLYLTGASAAAEALFLDRPVMIFDAPELISHNPMTSYDKVFMKVKDQSSLYQALSNVINGDIQIDLNEKKKLFNDIFANVIENSANNFKKIIKDAENECK
jgi:hypothetical protein